MHFLTSITSNYIPKARVLAASVKRHEPGAKFHLLLCDEAPPGFSVEGEVFDTLILLDDLVIPQKQSWIFQHNVVELCTAVKGLGFKKVFDDFSADKVVFLDPDIAVFSSLSGISARLDDHSILLTPHQTEPETTRAAVLDNEVSSLRFGVFNLGFLAVSNSPEGRRFIDWWSDRLIDFCFDERGKGLFTDQKWIDLAPAFFDDIAILREPQLNVSTWNISQRELVGTVETGLTVNGKPLCFYHFSGLDSGAMKVMMEVYGTSSAALQGLRQWYLDACDSAGQKELGNTPCAYDYYANGARVRPAERLLYRYQEELSELFPDPYDCSGRGGYRAWYRKNAGMAPGMSEDQEVTTLMQQELDAIRYSMSWRIFRRMTTTYRRLGLRLGLRRLMGRMGRGG